MCGRGNGALFQVLDLVHVTQIRAVTGGKRVKEDPDKEDDKDAAVDGGDQDGVAIGGEEEEAVDVLREAVTSEVRVVVGFPLSTETVLRIDRSFGVSTAHR